MSMSASTYPEHLLLRPVSGPINASVTLPGSKSITNRALLLAALAEGDSRLISPLHSDDTFYMVSALRELGVLIEETSGGDFLVHGTGGKLQAPDKIIFLGNSGTTVRFLTAAACLAPAGTDVVLDGVARMRERPIRDLLGALLTLGVNAESVNGHGCPPVRVRGGSGLPGGSCRLRGDVSSQFLTALLQVAPYAAQDVQIEIIEELISKPYIDITQSVMRSFGVEMQNDAYRRLTVEAGQRYAGREYAIEADASNASYFLAAAAVTGGSVTLENLGSESIQGDVRFVDVLERMGCSVVRGEKLSLTGPTQIRGIEADLTAIPDTAQTLAVVAAFADGPSHLTGLASLRVKETDRLKAITTELSKLGVCVDEGRDDWTITPPLDGIYIGTEIDTYDDHRMAMSFAVAGLRIPGITINDPGCVAKTFPDFWERWEEAFGHGQR